MSSEVTTIFVDLIARDKASKTLLKSVATLGAVGYAAVKFAKDSVDAFEKAQEAQDRLDFAYQKFPKLANVSLQSLDDLAKATQKKTIFDDEATKTSEALLAQFNLTGKQIEQLIPLVQDYAAATGQDLQSATISIGKAFEGNARALKAVGINFKATGNTAKDFATIQADLSAKVGGFAEKQGKTAAGQVKILGNQFNDLQETVGGTLVPALTKLVGVATTLTEEFNRLPDPVKEVAVGLAAVTVAATVVLPRIAATKAALIELGIAGKASAGGLNFVTVGLGKIVGAAGLVLAAESAINAKTGWFDRPSKSVQELQSNTDSLTKALNDSIPATQSWSDHLGLGLDNIAHGLIFSTNATDAARKSLADYDHQLAGLAKDHLPAASIAWDRIVAVGTKAGATLDELKAQFPELTGALGLNTGAATGNAAAINSQASAYGTLMAKLNAYLGRLEGGKRAQLAARQANRDALAALKDLGKQHTVTAQQADDAFGKILDAADAAAGAVQGAANKNVAYRNEIVKLRDHVKKGSPLYKSLTDYINHLNAIPSAVSTQVTANFAVKGYNAAIAAGQALANASRAAGTNNGRAPATATGGVFYTPQVRLIAEAGPEAVVPLGKAGALGTTVNVYVDGSVLTSDRDLAVAVARAIKSSGVRGTG